MASRARWLADRSILVVVGSGSLARAVCYGLGAVVEQPVDVVVAARAADKAAEVRYVAGTSVLCGIGNVALLAASLQTALGLEDQRRLKVLAHHVHLHAPERPDEEALHGLRDHLRTQGTS